MAEDDGPAASSEDEESSEPSASELPDGASPTELVVDVQAPPPCDEEVLLSVAVEPSAPDDPVVSASSEPSESPSEDVAVLSVSPLKSSPAVDADSPVDDGSVVGAVATPVAGTSAPARDSPTLPAVASGASPGVPAESVESTSATAADTEARRALTVDASTDASASESLIVGKSMPANGGPERVGRS